jgi:amidophosphoribosyltransferase
MQPIYIECKFGEIAVCHNGNLVNAHLLRNELVEQGSIFRTTSDTEVVLHLFAKSQQKDRIDAVFDAVQTIEGAFSLLFLTQDALFGVRDPRGFRPLILGRLDGKYVLCSETCALDLIDAEYIREVEPGEMVVVSQNGLRSLRPFAEAPPAHCVFEHVYFSRPDSLVFGRDVHTTRREMGRRLAREKPADADVVVPVPDSGVVAAIGYSQESGLPMELGLIRNHYVGRTFIEPRQSIRNFGVKVKLNPVRSVIEGQRVVLIDDSIVRGTTSKKIVAMVRGASAREVHFRVCSPPTIGPCHYGIDTPKREELIASSHSVEEIGVFLGADSLGYLSQDGLLASVGEERDRYCSACFSGIYPIPLPDKGRDQLKLFEKVRE